jgi:hypothetical protein
MRPPARHLWAFFLLLAFACYLMRWYFWDPAYKFHTFGGPTETLFVAAGTVCLALAAWLYFRRSRA